MPHYFFHIDGERPYRDQDGQELPGDEAAWHEGMRMTRDIETALRPGHDWHLDIMEGERPVYRIEVATFRRR